MRIIFMGTPEFAVPTLAALLRAADTEASRPNEPSASEAALHGASSRRAPEALKVVAVYTQPPRPKGRGLQLTPSPVHALAEQHGIPVFTPTSLKTPEEQEKFRALDADVAVVVAYGLLLPQAILDAPTHGCINIHPSSLPRWRGAAPIQRTVMAGDATTDICIMQMDAGLDTGDVLLRKSYAIAEAMNAGELHDMLSQKAPALLLETLAQLQNGTATRTPQAADGVTYAAKITKDACRIDWQKSATEIANHIRGLAPNMGATCVLSCTHPVARDNVSTGSHAEQGEILKIFAARVDSSGILRSRLCGSQDSAPGTVLDNRLAIACGSGVLLPDIVQRAGGGRQGVEAFLRGNPVAIGTKLS